MNDNFGCLPPSDIDLEKAVLGACLFDKEAAQHAVQFLVADDFYKQSHNDIFQSIIRLSDMHTQPEILSVTADLRKHETLESSGGPHYVAMLSSYINNAASIVHHSLVLKEMSIRRLLITFGTRLARDGFDNSIDGLDLLGTAISTLVEINKTTTKEKTTSLGEALLAVIGEINKAADDRRAGKPVIVGYPSGLNAWDRITGGFIPGHSNIIAARPGMGKTALMLSAAMAAARHAPVGIVSLEMTVRELALRAIADVTNVPSNRLRSGDVTFAEQEAIIGNLVAAISELPVFIVPAGHMDLRRYQGVVRNLVAEQGIKVLFADYLQLFSGSGAKGQNREQEISEISRTNKILAKEHDICVNALSQLSREVERRGGTKRPVLADLRESGAIEQDADNVTFIYRPEYYGVFQDEKGNSTLDRAELIVGKTRHTSPGIAEVAFYAMRTRFADLSYVETMPRPTTTAQTHWQESTSDNVPF